MYIAYVLFLFAWKVGGLIFIGIYVVQVLVRKTFFNIFPYLDEKKKQMFSYFQKKINVMFEVVRDTI